MFYFTNPSLVLPQKKMHAYGPYNPGTYRITSLHQAYKPNTPPQAISVTRGRICIIATNKKLESGGFY